MTVTMGANLQDLQALAQQFAQSAEQLRTIRATLGQRVVNNQGWRGGDADRFKAQWGSHDSAMALVASSLETGSTQLIDNVREQEQASDQATGSPGGGGGAGPGGSGGSGDGSGGSGDSGDGSGGGGVKDWLVEAATATSLAVGLGFKIKDVIGMRALTELVDSKKLVDLTNGLRNATYADEFLNDTSKFGKIGRFAGPVLAPLAIAGGIHDMINPEHSGARGVGDRIAGGLSVIGGGGTLLMAAGMLNPVGATIVIGAGLAAGAWAAGNYIYDNWDNITEFTGNVGETLSDAGNIAKDYAADRFDDAKDAVGDAAEDVGDFMKDPVGKLGGWLS